LAKDAEEGCMNGTKKACVPAVVLLVSLAFSCAGCTGFMRYREDLFYGYQCLREGDKRAALEQFLKATQADPTVAMPLALAGQATYQMGNYEQASRYLAQADGLMKGRDYALVIVRAYESLIAFREDRREEGMAALGDYVRVMGSRHFHPEKSYYEVERMYRSRNIALPRLEELMNYQISRYEGIAT
jgi:tetratricopeptide (TPR) repeat protein